MSTPENPFERPGTSEGFYPSKHPEWIGKLCIMRPNYVHYITFKPEEGPKKVVNTYVVFVDLQGPPVGNPVVIDGANIATASLMPQIENKIGKLVLGRLIQSPPQPGKSPSYQLDPNYTDQDASTAGQYIAAFPLPPVPDAPPPEPAAAAPAPAQGQWGQPQQPAITAPGQWGQAPVQQPYAPPPSDVWAGTNAQPAPAQAPAQQSWQQPAAPQAPAPPQAWQQQGQAPAQQPPAGQWGQAAAPPAAVPQPAAQQWQQPQPAAQDPQLVARVQAMGLQVTPDMDNNTLNMIVNSAPQ